MFQTERSFYSIHFGTFDVEIRTKTQKKNTTEIYIKECPYYADGYANEKQKDVQLEGILLVMV